jgi:hypothetical protein
VGPKGKDDRTGYGLIIARKALTANVPASAPNPVYEALDRWKAEQARQRRALTARPPGIAAPSGGGGSGGILIVGSGVVLLIVIGAVAVALVILRHRRSAAPPGAWGK